MKQADISKRQKTGQKAGVVSMFVNLFLAIGKFIAGAISNNIAIMADAINNLTDCASSLATIVGFRLSAKGKDEVHPFGHGRMEYVSGLVVSMIIIVAAVSLAQTSIGRIIDPQTVNFSWIPAVICIVAIGVKLGLALYVRFINKKVNSETLSASVKDSISDTLATTVALASLVLDPMLDMPIDGIFGLVVTVLIFCAGISSFWSNLNLTLGKGLTRAEHDKIHDEIRKFTIFDKVLEIDMHDYGPESRILIIKVHLAGGVDAKTASFENELRRCRREMRKKFGFEEVIIYWPPVD